MPGRLDGSVALVTGAARGLGAAHAQLFVTEGAKVVIGDVLDDEGRALSAELGEAASYIHLDVTDEEAWAGAVRQTVETFGLLDVLVNNAGVASFAPLVATDRSEYDRIVGVNQTGAFLGMQAVVGAMEAAGRGSIVNISSIDGIQGMPMFSAYVASKFALRGMTKVAAIELARSGIRVNSVHPGMVRTAMNDMMAGVDVERLVSPLIPLGRIAEPEEVARLSLFLASAESGYCTGAEFVIDGGWTAGIVTDLEGMLKG